MNYFIPLIAAMLIYSVASEYLCEKTALWQRDYGGDAGLGDCAYSNGKNKWEMVCHNKNDINKCGLRISSKQKYGYGEYFAYIDSIPGSGTCTAFYLFTYGRNNDRSQPWNEIDIEILGKSKQLTTNYFTGHREGHAKYHNLGFDPSQGAHKYSIIISTDKYITWKVDNIEYRKVSFAGYPDMIQTVNNGDFQLIMSTWGQDRSGSWSEMGYLEDSTNNFPLRSYFEPVINNDWFRGLKSNNGKCLEIESSQMYTDGGTIQSYDCNGQRQQRWIWTWWEGTRTILNEAGKCLDVHIDHFHQPQNAGLVQIWRCNNSPGQKWKILDNGEIQSDNGQCLDMHNIDYNNGANRGKIQLWDCNSSPQQKWIL